jgi:hypothetical protein
MTREQPSARRALGILGAMAAVGTVGLLAIRGWRQQVILLDSLEGQERLIDSVLPEYEFREVASVTIRATPQRIFDALREVSLVDMPLANALIQIRYLPGRFTGQINDDAAPKSAPILEQIALSGNIILAELPDQELVIGAIGMFHNMLDQQPLLGLTPDAFAAFSDGRYQKLVMSLQIAGGDKMNGYRLVMENRTHALSDDSRRKFGVYWWLMIKWGSAVMSRILLGAVKHRAESTA